MNDFTHDPEFTLDLILTRNLVDCVANSDFDVLDHCSLSLVRSATGNALLVTWRRQSSIDTALYLQLAELARLVQLQHGSTRICLRHFQEDACLSWSSEELIELGQRWKISPSL